MECLGASKRGSCVGDGAVGGLWEGGGGGCDIDVRLDLDDQNTLPKYPAAGS